MLCAGALAALAVAECAGAQTGPTFTFFGLANANHQPLAQDDSTPQGDPIFQRATGTGFVIVIEGKPGMSGLPVGESRFDAVSRPDLQVQLSNDLGDGNPEVCGMFNDGVPASGTGDFAPGQGVTAALNDFACRFEVSTSSEESCLLNGFGEGYFGGGPSTTTQFCSGLIGPALAFPDGETMVSFRLRDSGGNVGQVRRIIVRVGAVFTPTPTTSTATRSATPSATVTPPATTAPPATSTPTRTASTTRTATAPAPSPTPTSPFPSATSTPLPQGTATPPFSPCDVDGDGTVDDDDLAAVVRAIFTASYVEAADVNGIPGVTAADIVALLRLRLQERCE